MEVGIKNATSSNITIQWAGTIIGTLYAAATGQNSSVSYVYWNASSSTLAMY